MVNNDPVLGGLGTATWTHEEGISYEVALEGINHVVGAYAGLIARKRTTDPESPAITAWKEQQEAWERRRRSLHADDHQAVAAVRAECKALLPRLREELLG
ncbi:hypothetical protein KV557_24475 [Kitasatospora aureofaciens]|uniref:hypothetical protein n=1 Tax=Kitasatospora aureofaciens TaxID=1894 RepID=UPI001C457B9F|nr:hypothetical protein [Kitasatospora aureofaciens]MBV6700220.1 hypothetical protein [Kitasatospora aureofaciens]